MAAAASQPSSHNGLLARLSSADRAHLLKGGREVDLEFGETLSDSNERIRFVYFPTTSYISLITPKGTPSTTETMSDSTASSTVTGMSGRMISQAGRS